MGRPGNKRLQRALYGAAPSSATGSHTTEGTGRYEVTRVTGSVINNGGNMRSGGYPRVGMGLAFLRKTRCNPLCDSFVGRDEDLKTQLELAIAFIAARSAAVRAEQTANDKLVEKAAKASELTAGNPASAVNVAAEQVAIKAEAVALANYNAAVTALAAMNAKDAMNAKGAAAGKIIITAHGAHQLNLAKEYVLDLFSEQDQKVAAAAAALKIATDAADAALVQVPRSDEAISSTAAEEATKLADYNAKHAVLVAMNVKKVKGEEYVKLVDVTEKALGVYNDSSKTADDLSAYNDAVADEAAALLTWMSY